MQNFWLFAFVVAVFGVEWRFYSWHQPQIDQLEHMREQQIKSSIKRFLERHQTPADSAQHLSLLHHFFIELTSDQDIAIPVGGKFNPHKKIFRLLLFSIIISLCYGAFATLCVSPSKPQIHLIVSDAVAFYIKLALAVLTLIPLCLAAWLGWGEFEYVLRIKEKFKTHSKTGIELRSDFNLSSASQSEETIRTKQPEQVTDTKPTLADTHLLPANRGLIKLEIEVLKLFSNFNANFQTERIAEKLHLHPFRAEKLLEGLTQQQYLYQSTRIGLPPTFRLTSKGRDYLIQNNLI